MVASPRGSPNSAFSSMLQRGSDVVSQPGQSSPLRLSPSLRLSGYYIGRAALMTSGFARATIPGESCLPLRFTLHRRFRVSVTP